MFLELILALLIGIFAGTLTGLTPGIHINLLAAILIASLTTLTFLQPITLAVFIVSMAITHTFLDFIPSIFLGAPDEDSFLAVLPGHEMLVEGKGQQAVLITLIGSLVAIPIIFIIAPIFVFSLPTFFPIIKTFIPYLLIFISFYLILREEDLILSLVIFLLAGFLGLFSFYLPIKEPLLPLLSGMFGLSALIISLKSKSTISPQINTQIKSLDISKQEILKSSFAAFLTAPLCSFLPGIGSGHAAVIGSEIFPQSKKGFLFLVGAINTIVMALSFFTIFAIGRARSGAAATIQTLLPEITIHNLITISITIIISSIIAFIIGLKISNLFAKIITKVNYKKLTITIIIILITINILFTNWIGLITLTTATALGIFCILSRSRRINLMGALIIPVIVFYLIN